MTRRVLTFGVLAALAGCLTKPPLPQAPPPGPPPGVIRLFGKEMPAGEAVIREEIGRLIQPGMPLEQATEILVEHSLGQWRGSGLLPREMKFGMPRPLEYGVAPVTVLYVCPLLPEWGRRCCGVRVVLHPGYPKDIRMWKKVVMEVKEIEVLVSAALDDPARPFFDARPGLREPVGLTVAEAQGVMQAAGFACTPVSAPGKGGRPRLHLFCAAAAGGPASWALLGVRLYPDEAGVVRDTEIVRQDFFGVRLFGKELPSDEGLIRDELLRLLPAGTPRDQALARLQSQGFQEAENPDDTERYERNPWARLRDLWAGAPQVYCAADRPVLGNWGQGRARIGALLTLDAAGALAEIKVRVSPRHFEPDKAYFEAHPELAEPVGLPLAEAEARMRAAGFRCVRDAGTGPGGRGREHVLCEARDNRFLDGRMVRVRLFPDGAGVVRDTDILGDCRWFDAERAMLPFSDDPAGEYALRAALFPVHVTARYTTFAAMITAYLALESIAHGGLAHGCGHGR